MSSSRLRALRRWGAHQRQAPLALRHHPSVLAGVFVAAMLIAIAASSSPLVTTAVASEALQTRLTELTRYASGLVISGESPPAARSVAGALRQEQERTSAARRFAAGDSHVGQPVLTLETAPDQAVTATGPRGEDSVRLMSRTGFLAHITVVAKSSGTGVWISDITANATGIRPGGVLKVTTPAFGQTRPVVVRMRVQGIYRTLAHSPLLPYWVNLEQDFYPQGPDASVPATYVLMGEGRLLRALYSSRVNAAQGMVEWPIATGGITLPAARALGQRFDAVRAGLRTSSLGQELRCSSPSLLQRCTVASSISAAVILADGNASAVSPAVTLLSDAGVGIALAVAASVGAFLVRRRRAEAAFLYARGEHVAAFGGRTAIEALLPTIGGAAAGFGVALLLGKSFAPRGAIDAATRWSALTHAGIAAAAGLLLLVLSAAVGYLRLFDSGAWGGRSTRLMFWELPLLAAAIYLLIRITHGGGLAGPDGGRHPTLAVFVFPLALVAAVAGLAARLARPALLRSVRRRRAPAIHLALRRLLAARGLLIVLVVVSAVAFGAFFYSETLASSLSQTTREKAYMATGSDATAELLDLESVPRRFPYPLTEVQFANQAAAIGTAEGTDADVILVDPATLPEALHWEHDWGPNPSPLIEQLNGRAGSPIPVIVTPEIKKVDVLYFQGIRVPVRVVGTVPAFPGRAAGIPLVVTGFHDIDHASKIGKEGLLGFVQTYAWVKGPPVQAQQALASSTLGAYFPASIETFLRDPNVLLATRTYSYMRLTALGAAALVLVGLLLYLQARQRSQVIASALSRRMGLRRRSEVLSLFIELGAILLFAAVLGGVIALAAVAPVIRQIDPLPQQPPGPILVLPTAEILGVVLALLVVTLSAALATSWLARRADPSEALRVA